MTLELPRTAGPFGCSKSCAFLRKACRNITAVNMPRALVTEGELTSARTRQEHINECNHSSHLQQASNACRWLSVTRSQPMPLQSRRCLPPSRSQHLSEHISAYCGLFSSSDLVKRFGSSGPFGLRPLQIRSRLGVSRLSQGGCERPQQPRVGSLAAGQCLNRGLEPLPGTRILRG